MVDRESLGDDVRRMNDIENPYAPPGVTTQVETRPRFLNILVPSGATLALVFGLAILVDFFSASRHRGHSAGNPPAGHWVCGRNDRILLDIQNHSAF